MEPMDLLADTRRYLDSPIRQLEAINAGAPIAEPVRRERSIPSPSRSAFLRVCCVDMEGGKMPADPKGQKRQEGRWRAQL